MCSIATDLLYRTKPNQTKARIPPPVERRLMGCKGINLVSNPLFIQYCRIMIVFLLVTHRLVIAKTAWFLSSIICFIALYIIGAVDQTMQTALARQLWIYQRV